jgi:hypothetical protein
MRTPFLVSFLFRFELHSRDGSQLHLSQRASTFRRSEGYLGPVFCRLKAVEAIRRGDFVVGWIPPPRI